ncbi:MAG: HI0074 family nucleotidyltransferase substrate-binding subunit [bacterium]
MSSLEKSVTAMVQILERAEDGEFMSSLDDITRNAIRAGVIQHFEFTYELCWKFMQRWIRLNRTPEDGDHPRSRKDLFRMAAHCGLIADQLPWFAYGEARNITSHTYDDEKAESVYGTAKQFVRDTEYLLTKLQKAND